MTDESDEAPTPRPSARLIVLDETGAALLFQFTFPDRVFWGTPGGALDPGETYAQAAARELMEETGITAEIGEDVHKRHTIYRGPHGDMLEADERFFLVHTQRRPIDQSNWEPFEREVMTAVEWLTPDQIQKLDHPVFPENFAELVAKFTR